MNVGESVRFNYTGNIQQLVIEKSGIYKLETWASSGSGISNGSFIYTGGNGGYSLGYKKLRTGDILYIGVGSKPSDLINWSPSYFVSGGYNGGGNGYNYYNGSDRTMNGAGGGATHIALNSNRGTLPNYANNQDEVLIVSGGGGGAYGYWDNTSGAGFYGANSGGGGNTFGQGADQSGGGFGHSAGGGGWQGGANNRGGTNNVDNVPTFTYRGTTYAPSMQNGVNSGNGYAIITMVAKTSSLKLGNKDVSTYLGNKEVELYKGNKILG